MTTAWITASDVWARMTHLKPTGIDTSSEIKEELCQRACSWIEKECAIRVIRDPLNPIRRRFNGNGRGRLELPYNPIRAITELNINNSPVTFGTSSQYATNAVKAYFDSTGLYSRSGFPGGLANVLVGYESGYDLADVPGYLKSLAEAKAILMFVEKDRWGIRSKMLPSQTVEFVRELMAEEKETMKSLKDYRWVVDENFGGVEA